MPTKNSKPLTVRFSLDMRQAITDAAKAKGVTDGMLVKLAVGAFLGDSETEPLGTHASLDEAQKEVEQHVKPRDEVIEQPATEAPAAVPLAEPSLANTEKGFRLGVEVACDRVARNVRLGVKMSTGITMGEDIAKRIRMDLLG